MDLINIKQGGKNEVIIRARGHELTGDRSSAEGGDDLGLSPSELLAASVGSCIAMVVIQYCDRHDYSNGPVEVNLTYEMSANPNRISAITVDIEIPGDVPESKRGILQKLVKQCPIHQTLINPPEIDIDIISSP